MRRADLGAAALPAAAAAVVAFALLFARGSSDTRLFWIGVAVVLVAVVAGLVAPPRVGGEAAAFVGFLLALAVWEGVTIAWSIQPSRSWDYANRTLVYVAFACVGVLLASVPRSWIANGVGLLLTLVILVALAGKVFATYDDYARLARLRWPLAYWNELALLCAMNVPLGLWLAGRRERPLRARVAGALHVYVAGVAVVLTFSRFGIILAVVGALVWTWIDRERFDSLGALVVGAVPAAVVAGVGLALHGIADDGVSHHARARDGAIFGVVFLAGAAVTAVAAWFVLAREPNPVRRRLFARGAAAAFAGACVVLLVVLVVRAGGPIDFVRVRWHEFASTQSVNRASRLGSASSGNRWLWWKQAWHSFTHHPGGGTGAGSFGLTSTVQAHNSIQATVEPHNTPLQFLAETGIVGFLCYAGAVAAAVVGFLRGPRDRATLALALVAAIGLVHSVIDIDWSYVATQSVLFVVAGVIVQHFDFVALSHKVRRKWLPAVAVVVGALAVLYSLWAPWYSRHETQVGLAAAGRLDRNAARKAFDNAHASNPLAVEPLMYLGAVEDSDAPFKEATRREPRNPETWYALAQFYAGNEAWPLAYAAASRSYNLDRYGPAGQPGNVGVRARCHVLHPNARCP